MTDRYNALTVVLERDIRDDDAEQILAAIRCLRGVLSVTGNVVDIADHVARERAVSEIGEKLWRVLHEEKS
jgi:hypothetical protein